jgi:hypothetical protein
MATNSNHTITSGVYIIIGGKVNNNIIFSVYKSNNLDFDNSNNVISNSFPVVRVEDFYNFLYNHPVLLKGKKDDNSFLLSEDEFKQFLKIAKHQQKYYIDTQYNNDNKYVPKVININRGNKIQKYLEDGTLLKTFIGIRDATRQETISDTSLKSAISNKTIYNGNRWLYLDRNLPDDTIQEIGESTKVNKHKNSLIAMIDIDKTHIVNVFENQKAASIARKLKSSSAIYQSIMKGNLCSGHYFKYYDDCLEDFKNKYIESGNILPSYCNKGVSIKQINYITGDVIREFPSIIDVQKQFQMSNKCIKKAIATNEIVKGFKWSY